MIPWAQETHRDQNGQTLVEFAIAFPIQLFITLGIMQLAMIFVAKQVVNYSAFVAARAEVVREELRDYLVEVEGMTEADADNQIDAAAGTAAAMVCGGIAGNGDETGRVTDTEFEPIELPGWGFLVPRAQSTTVGKSSFARAKTYVWRLDTSSGQRAWTPLSQNVKDHAEWQVEPDDVPLLNEARANVGLDDRTVVVAVAHDFELVFPFVNTFFEWLCSLNPRLSTERTEPDIPTIESASDLWGTSHIRLGDVGVQYRSYESTTP